NCRAGVRPRARRMRRSRRGPERPPPRRFARADPCAPSFYGTGKGGGCRREEIPTPVIPTAGSPEYRRASHREAVQGVCMTRTCRLLLFAALAAGLTMMSVVPASASSHREAPLAAADPQIDATDLYAFVSPDAPETVTLVSNWIPFESPAGGPNFYPWAENTKYDINIDNNGDAKADIVYRWTFTNHYKSKDTFLYNTGPVNSINDANLNFTQTYNLERIAGGTDDVLLRDAPVAPSYVGIASMPSYDKLRDQAIPPFASGKGKSFTGQ